jgi:hypothetical protein
MRRFVVVAVVALLPVMIGCRRAEPPKPESKPATTDSNVTAVPQHPQESPIDGGFLVRQALRAKEVRGQLDAWKKDLTANRGEYRELVLKRKGELMFSQKDIRNAANLSQHARDSLSAPLDSESIELAEELIKLK